MSLRFTVLASGSSGNASLVEADGFGLLIDVGLGPRQLASRLAAAGSSWPAVQAVLLTHTHSDHWKVRTLAHLCRHRIPLYCHPDSHSDLQGFSPAFVELAEAGLIRSFESGEEFIVAQGLRCRPLPLRHDSGATFGFRIEGPRDLFGQGAAVGYAADLGCWDEALADALADVDLLAIEFNHDRAMELASGRSPRLIGRVLGDEGHLSNTQGAALVRAVLGRSEVGRIRHLVQLHLSRHCNRPSLAREAAKAILDDFTFRVELHTARQDEPGTTLHLGAAPDAGKRGRRLASRATSRRRAVFQQALPGIEEAGRKGAAK
jgi:phosphoribosyl 1,2-cyclic phosphodiesterase